MRGTSQELREHASSDIVIILCANKTDLKGQRQVSTAEGQECADRFEIPCMYIVNELVSTRTCSGAVDGSRGDSHCPVLLRSLTQSDAAARIVWSQTSVCLFSSLSFFLFDPLVLLFLRTRQSSRCLPSTPPMSICVSSVSSTTLPAEHRSKTRSVAAVAARRTKAHWVTCLPTPPLHCGTSRMRTNVNLPHRASVANDRVGFNEWESWVVGRSCRSPCVGQFRMLEFR
jgi:hypothetical protein